MLTIDDSNVDSFRVFLLIKTLQELQQGKPDTVEMAGHLHRMLCDSDADDTFSSLFEQQDCYDLMLYLLDKVTTVTAKFARESREDQEGLRVSVQLQKELQASTLSGSGVSTAEDLTES